MAFSSPRLWGDVVAFSCCLLTLFFYFFVVCNVLAWVCLCLHLYLCLCLCLLENLSLSPHALLYVCLHVFTYTSAATPFLTLSFLSLWCVADPRTALREAFLKTDADLRAVEETESGATGVVLLIRCVVFCVFVCVCARIFSWERWWTHHMSLLVSAVAKKFGVQIWGILVPSCRRRDAPSPSVMTTNRMSACSSFCGGVR